MKRKKKYEGMSFEALAKIIHGYMKEDGLGLDFRGFRDVLQRYFRLQEYELADIHELMIDCNLWYNYLSDIQSFVEFKKEEWLLESEWLFAHEVMAEPSESLENQIQRAKERSKHYGMFSKQVESQIKFFLKASGHCQSLYKRGVQSSERAQ